MTIIKQAHVKQYVCISNELAQNNKLSLRARGLMAYLLSLPDHWEVHVTHLVSVLQEGRNVILDIIKELRAAGYIHTAKAGFQGKVEYHVHELPITEEEFKKRLQSMRNLNSLEIKQFEDRPLESTNPSRNPLDFSKEKPPLSPPEKKTKKEEDFSSKRKKEEASRSKTVQKIVDRWKEEGRPQRVIDATVKAYFERPLGSVKSVASWLETVYMQKFESADADELYEIRRKFAEKMENQSSSNYYFAKDKDLLCYTSGQTCKEYDIKGTRKGSEEFWQQNKLGKQGFVEWKTEQRSANGTCRV